LSDANKRKSVDFFAGVYHDLIKVNQKVISDAQFKQVINKQSRSLKLSLDENTVYVSDKGYNDYKAFKLLKGNFPFRLGDNGNAIKYVFFSDC